MAQLSHCSCSASFARLALHLNMHCRRLKDLASHCQVTAILYANPSWAPAHGGELRMWIPPGASDRHCTDGAWKDDCAAPDEHKDGSASVPPLDEAHLASTRSVSSPSSDDLGRRKPRSCDIHLPVKLARVLICGLCTQKYYLWCTCTVHLGANGLHHL